MEAFPDSPILGMSSPRISFSHDLPHPSEAVPVEEHYIRSQAPSCDFDFCVFRQTFDCYEASSADELFFDGKILPIQVKKKLPPIPNAPPTPVAVAVEVEDLPPPESPGKASRRSSEKPKSSSSWLFRRSSSLNCGGGHSGSSLCPLPLLSRSFSTGSSTTGKQRPHTKHHQQHTSNNNILKHHKDKGNNTSSCYSGSNSSTSTSRPPWKPKSNNPSTNYYHGVKFQPILNVLLPPNLLPSIFSGRINKKN